MTEYENRMVAEMAELNDSLGCIALALEGIEKALGDMMWEKAYPGSTKRRLEEERYRDDEVMRHANAERRAKGLPPIGE